MKITGDADSLFHPTVGSGFPGLQNRAFQPPALPIGVVAQGVYYFPDAVDYDYLTYSLAAQFRISTPLVSPYALDLTAPAANYPPPRRR